jgi:hypothetical protein
VTVVQLLARSVALSMRSVLICIAS